MKKLIIPLLCVLLLFCSCNIITDDDRLTIVATMFPQYCFAKEVAGDNADVEMLLDFGVDAHSYEPTPADIMKISRADLFIYTGDSMEIWAKTLLESADVKKAIESGSLHVLDLSANDSITLLPMHEHEDEQSHGHEEYDTHIWTSAKNAAAMCKAIASKLEEIDVANKSAYNENLLAVLTKAELLEEKITNLKNEFGGKTLYFGGSFAFRYLFDEAGLEHASVYEGCASHAEPSAAALAKMVSEIKESGAEYVLYDTLSEQKIANSIAAECGATVLHLHAIHNITKAEFDADEDYFSLMEKNIETLRKALS